MNWGDRTGRWRSVYVVDYEKATIVGTISITVHYYEAGTFPPPPHDCQSSKH